MGSTSIMVPIAGLQSTGGSSDTNSMLSLNQSIYETTLNQPHHASKSNYPGYGSVGFPADKSYSYNPWLTSLPKESQLSHKENHDQLPLSHPTVPEGSEQRNGLDGIKKAVLSEPLSLNYNESSYTGRNQAYFTCRLPEVPMNGAEKITMTGSTNPKTEELSWLSEVASAVSKGTLTRTASVENEKNNACIPTPAMHDALLSNAGSPFSPSLVIARPSEIANSRVFVPPFQVDRSRLARHASVPFSSSGTSLYYTQAPRSMPYSNFFQTTYPSSMPHRITTTLSSQPIPTTESPNPSEQAMTYLQVENYSSLTGLNPGLQPLGALSHASTSYLQHPSSPTSPTNLVIPPSVPHNRMYPQNRGILISRSPEGVVIHSSHERDPPQVRVQLSPQLQEEAARRKSFTSVDSVLGSSSCSPISENSSTLQPADLSKDYTRQSNTSPIHVGYRIPTGKEGSLKHRILRPPSINIVDPPQSAVADAPLSAPPIRTHQEPSPKQPRSIPSSGYRSFSSSASSVAEMSSRGVPMLASPIETIPNHHSSISSGSLSPVPSTSPSANAQLKYPQSFMKGAIIQLANNQLKQVENLTTEDFIECGMLSSTLRIDSSTVVSIEKSPATGSARLGFHVGQDSIQITVEAPLEHPFFVYKQGWSSCSPERSLQRYRLSCHKLKVGDICISLTDKPKSSNSGGQKAASVSVPISGSSTSTLSDQNLPSEDTAKEHATQNLCLNLSDASPSERQKFITQSGPVVYAKKSTPLNTVETESSRPRKRKRRWSAPDNLSQNEDTPSLLT